MNSVTERNIQTLSEGLIAVRSALSALHLENEALRSDNLQLRQEIGRIEQRVNQMIVRLYSGGATSGNND